jgi:hypothetical protein
LIAAFAPNGEAFSSEGYLSRLAVDGLYRLRKNSLHEGHGFSRAALRSADEGFSP